MGKGIGIGERKGVMGGAMEGVVEGVAEGIWSWKKTRHRQQNACGKRRTLQQTRRHGGGGRMELSRVKIGGLQNRPRRLGPLHAFSFSKGRVVTVITRILPDHMPFVI